jgi:outer membrane receptor protein involved in Fe transport
VWQGPVAASIFPQWSFPAGRQREGVRDGEYSLYVPLDVSREIGDFTLVGEGAFLWRYHQRAGPNEFQIGLAAYYDVTPKLELLGEQRVNLPTHGQGTEQWLFNLGAAYKVNDRVTVFGAAGRSFAASSRVEENPFMVLVGFEVTLGPWN